MNAAALKILTRDGQYGVAALDGENATIDSVFTLPPARRASDDHVELVREDVFYAVSHALHAPKSPFLAMLWRDGHLDEQCSAAPVIVTPWGQGAAL